MASESESALHASGPSLVPWAATATVHTACPNQAYSSNPHRLETVSRNVHDRTLNNNERTSPTLPDRRQEEMQNRTLFAAYLQITVQTFAAQSSTRI